MSNKQAQQTMLEANGVQHSDRALVEGLIVDGSRGIYMVETAAIGVLRCTIRGRLRKQLEYAESASARRGVRKVVVKPHDPVAVGNRVRVLPTGGDGGVIEEVMAQEGGAFTRRDPDPKFGDLTTIAGLDQMVIVFAARNPEPHLGLLDRFLVVAEAQNIAPLVCFNKADQGFTPDLDECLCYYERLGYPVLRTSVMTGEGVADLHARLAGHTSAFLGASGVGKSSLLNAVEPGLGQLVSAVSESTGKGRHTTTGTRLFPLGGSSGGYIADTAGIRALGLNSEMEAQLDQYMIEFRPYLGTCHLADCTHMHEPSCTIRAAVRDGEIDGRRYASYCRMRGTESAEIERFWDDNGTD